LAFGNNPNWSVRIGLKGPERFDRAGYPPIPLEPAEVTNEAAIDSWTYHAKDTQTGAAVAVHLTREPCSDASIDTLTTAPPPGGRYSFRAAVDHGQIGSLKGCGRIATELFPRINNQPDQQDTDTKKKPPIPISTVTKFQSPTAVAYVNASQQLVFKRGSVIRIIPGKAGNDLSASHDGKKLLFVRDEGSSPIRTLNQYDSDLNSVKELFRGDVRNPVWSPDDSRVAYLNGQVGKRQLWIFPYSDPSKTTVLNADGFDSIQGWSDARTVLAISSNQANLVWIGEDGKVSQSLSLKDLCGFDFVPSTNLAARVNPLNPDLVLISANFGHPPAGIPAGEGQAGAFFLYEFRAKRRVLLPVASLSSSGAEWSRDGLQILFTGLDASRRSSTYRIFWDGIGLQKYVAGTGLVVGQ